MPSSTTLLVAYPKEVIRAGLRVMLEKTGIKIVAEADDVASALFLAKKHGPDMVLLDAFSTAGRGYRAAEKIRKTNPGTKVIFLAAVENPTYLAKAKAVGASNVLLSPSPPKSSQKRSRMPLPGSLPNHRSFLPRSAWHSRASQTR